MSKSIRVLIAEDSEDNALMLIKQLKREGYDVSYVRVETAEDMKSAIDSDLWDLILADYNMSKLNALKALEIMNEKGIDLPFIVVSGAIGEETAVSIIKSGAHDYVMKDNLTRLVPAIERELKDAENRKKQKKAEKEIKKFKTIADNANYGVIITDLLGNIIYSNDYYTVIHGYNTDEIKNKNINIFYPDLQNNQVKEIIADIIKNDHFTATEVWYKRKEGAIFPMLISGVIIKDEDETPMYMALTAIDITKLKKAEKEQKKLEFKLQQSQKMEAVGTLAGGIAHDFNNLLMGIQGNASLILLDINKKDPLYEKVNNIEQYVQSGAKLTKQLLGFARSGKYEVKPTDINILVNKTAQMFGRTQKDISINENYQNGIWISEVDQGQIEQVLLNLFVNAWQAMPNGGNITIETKNIELEKKFVKPFNVNPGKYIQISVTDTGIGMDEATRQRIFEPFFTTNEMGRGTGLGLASAYGIVKHHGGIIDAHSKEKQGTKFSIYLPATEKKMQKEKTLAEKLQKGSETILLIDDEEIIIKVAKQMLEKLGYNVFIASSGAEAIELYKNNIDQIHMIILDMIMPDMNGSVTFDRLKEINMDLKILLSSGYSLNGQATSIMERECNGFIQKPFNITELSEKIRYILDNV